MLAAQIETETRRGVAVEYRVMGASDWVLSAQLDAPHSASTLSGVYVANTVDNTAIWRVAAGITYNRTPYGFRYYHQKVRMEKDETFHCCFYRALL
jgi:hypothetical protein